MKKSQPRTRRTTLTLPTADLSAAEKIARSRNVNLSVVVGEALHEGLQSHVNAQAAARSLQSYRLAFSGLTEDEMALLDGVFMEPIRRR